MRNVTTADIINAETNNGWESDREIVQAILEIAADDEDANRIWADPTEEQREQVVARAWELADEDTDALYWGQTEITR